MTNRVSIEQSDNTVSQTVVLNTVMVNEPDQNTVTVYERVVGTVTVKSPGPTGGQGPQGIPGESASLGGYVTTSSFNSFTSSYNSGSFTGSFDGNLSSNTTFNSQPLVDLYTAIAFATAL